MKTKYFMTKKEYSKQLTDKFWKGKEHIGIEYIVKAYEMHNMLVAFTHDFIDTHDEINYPFSKTINHVYETAKKLLSKAYPNMYNEKFWESREHLKSTIKKIRN